MRHGQLETHLNHGVEEEATAASVAVLTTITTTKGGIGQSRGPARPIT
jgi:hypothetical protein